MARRGRFCHSSWTAVEHPVRRHLKGELPPVMNDETRRRRETAAGLFALRMYREHRAG
ncbi:MAG TPA: hypothetical protein VIJ22_00900 [Polyangiaceae bacterium]